MVSTLISLLFFLRKRVIVKSSFQVFSTYLLKMYSIKLLNIAQYLGVLLPTLTFPKSKSFWNLFKQWNCLNSHHYQFEYFCFKWTLYHPDTELHISKLALRCKWTFAFTALCCWHPGLKYATKLFIIILYSKVISYTSKLDVKKKKERCSLSQKSKNTFFYLPR